MPYTYIYLYIVVVGIIFPLVSLCAHTITHTSMRMMYSVRDNQESKIRKGCSQVKNDWTLGSPLPKLLEHFSLMYQ